MYRYIFPLCLLLSACDETGSFTLTDGGLATEPGTVTPVDDPTSPGTDPGDPTDPSTTDEETPPEPPAPPVSADNCGVYKTPEADQLGDVSTTSSGEAMLRSTGGWDATWTWEGCQADRVFDPQGEFVCEIVYDVSGELRGGFNWEGPDFIYDLSFRVDTATTTCTNGEDQSWALGFDLGFGAFDNMVELKRARPGRDSWDFYADATYDPNNNFDEISIEYSTDF